MLKEERQDLILKELHLHNKVLSAELSDKLDVSLDTVRRDLLELAKNGKILKVHGGAVSKSFHYPFQQPQVYAREQKKVIAKKALRLIQDGMIVLAGGGTVMLELAKIIPPNLKGTFFTVSPLIALEVAQRSTVNVILLAGQLSRNTYICTGAAVISQLSEIQVDLCLVGTNGLAVNEGMTDYDWEVVQVKKAMIKSSQKTAVLGISEKLDTSQKMKICNLNALTYLVTELDPADKKLIKYHTGIKIL